MDEEIASPLERSAKIDELSRRIDDIMAFQKKPKPWYDTGLIISGLAFFISLVTTVLSLYRTHQQDINNLKTQLRNTIQQSGALVLQSVEMQSKYKDNQQTMLALSSALNSQNIGLAREAYTLTKALGSNATSLDLLGSANALINSEEYSLAEELLKDAVARATRAVEHFSVANPQRLAIPERTTGRSACVLQESARHLRQISTGSKQRNFRQYHPGV
jgi:hypothetical protein